jgi:hypothetical protein
MKVPYTSRQGQFLAFIHNYTTLHGRPPAEAEMAHFFQVTPPSAHLKILALERRGLITRTPSDARSIKLRLPPEILPPLRRTLQPTALKHLCARPKIKTSQTGAQPYKLKTPDRGRRCLLAFHLPSRALFINPRLSNGTSRSPASVFTSSNSPS